MLLINYFYLYPFYFVVFQSNGIINVPNDVENIELAIIYWSKCAGTVHTINVRGNLHVNGEYLRIGHEYPLKICGEKKRITTLNGGVRIMGKNTKNIILSNLTVSSQSAASATVPRHGLLVNNEAHCIVKNCVFSSCGGSGVCVRKGCKAVLINCSTIGNKFSGLYAVGGGQICLQESFEAIDNGHTIRGCQIEASGMDSLVTGVNELIRLKKIKLVRNTFIQFDRCLGRNKSFTLPSTREHYGGRIF
jgi:hypothetical protein